MFIRSIILLVISSVTLMSCGNRTQSEGPSNIKRDFEEGRADRQTIADLFTSPSTNTTIRVNKYLWSASLETLNFMPLESADPFTGILQFGFGTAPGSNRAFRATVLVQDPALDARSLKVSLQSRSGPASAEMTRQVENAILTRARQLRIRDSGL
ncbi:MAG: DUF3576 domain-containing protein [Pseudomonadota bacterium]